jgi:glycosyltransferase involved in cell wall biosynthesis
MPPTVSVVIPTVNRAQAVVRAIESVLAQEHSQVEVLVIDDGSTDDTTLDVGAIAAGDSRVKLILHSRNLGAQAARNSGIRAAIGDWITFLDSDDIYLPGSIERRLAAAAATGATVVHSACIAIDRDGVERIFPVPAIAGDVYRDVLGGPGPVFGALMVRRDAVERLGDLDEDVRSFQEWDTAIRLARTEQFAFVSQPTFLYDLRPADSISRNAKRTADGYEDVVTKHRSEIKRVLGRRGLAAHDRYLVHLRAAAADRRGAIAALVRSVVAWPFAPRGITSALTAITQPT